MKEQILKQISGELKAANKADLVTMIVSISIMLILFGVALGFSFGTTNAALSSLMGARAKVVNAAPIIIMFVALLAIIAVNWFSVRTLLANKKQRAKLNEGLMALYKDEGVDKYYDGSIFKTYEGRYSLYTILLTAVGEVAVIAPVVTFINNLIV